MEDNKEDLINKHEEVIGKLKNNIEEQNEQINDQKVENEKSQTNLNDIKYGTNNELNKKFYD
jgi:hypothetical protein